MVLFIQCTCLYEFVHLPLQLLCIFYSLECCLQILCEVKYFSGMLPANILWYRIFFGFLFHLKMLLIWMTLCAGGLITPVWISTFLSQHSVHQFPSVNFFVSPYLTWYLHPGSYILQSIIFQISICSQQDNDLMKSKFRSCWKQWCLWYQGRDLCNITTSLHCRNWSSSWWRQYSFDDRNSRLENATILLTIMPFIVWNITVCENHKKVGTVDRNISPVSPVLTKYIWSVVMYHWDTNRWRC